MENNQLIPIEEKGEIVLYQPDDNVRLEVRLQDDTVWLTQQQMAELFNTTRNNITLHIGNIFKEGELEVNSVRKESLLTAADGKKYRTKFYNLDVIISVGYRVKSQVGTRFRQWALAVLKDYLLRGYAVHQQVMALQQINLRIDAQNDRIARIEGALDQQQQQLDFDKHNQQYEPISYVQLPHPVHDRYLIVDDDVWLLGTSVKDMGRSLCTIIKVGFTPETVMTMIK